MAIVDDVDAIINRFHQETGRLPAALTFSVLAWDLFRATMKIRQIMMVVFPHNGPPQYRGVPICVNPDQPENILIVGAIPHVAKGVPDDERPLGPGQLAISRDGCGVTISMMFKDEYEAIAHADSWRALAKAGRLALIFNLSPTVGDDGS